MANLTGVERARYVQGMFTRIAQRYDLMNRLMTIGQDVHWRVEVIRRAELPGNARLLDLGAGTGDLAFEALRQHPDCQPVAADFTLQMMYVGQQRAQSGNLDWAAGDAMQLPFLEASFEAVVSGFLLRNVSDIATALSEQYRILKPGGRIVTLDTTRPPQNILTPLINFHLHTVIPTLGGWITGSGEAYHYLPDSTESFLTAEALADKMIGAGFRQVGFLRLMFSTVAIHWGVK